MISKKQRKQPGRPTIQATSLNMFIVFIKKEGLEKKFYSIQQGISKNQFKAKTKVYEYYIN